MSDALKTEVYKGLTIEIHQDTDPENPRDWENFGKMLCFHRRYTLGDKHGYKAADYSGWDALEAAVRQGEDAALMLPLYLYDHSVLSISTESFLGRAQHAEWDSGRVGWIVVSHKALLAEYGGKKITKKVLARGQECLESEVKVYDQYLRGEVYGFKILDAAGKELDSCWGFFGGDCCMAEAKAQSDREVTKLDDAACTVTLA